MMFLYIVLSLMIITILIMLLVNFIPKIPTTKRMYGPLKNHEGETLTVYMNKFPIPFANYHVFVERTDVDGFALREEYDQWYMRDYAEESFAKQVNQVKRECGK